MAWDKLKLKKEEETKLLNDLEWVLNIWSKNYLGHDELTKIIDNYYISSLPKCQNKTDVYKELDLVICFFQHYIYAFEEFMTREFRDSVIRCGLICERLVKRLAIAAAHPEVLQIKNFEDKVNKLMNLFSKKVPDFHFLANRMKYIYAQRSRRGAHDTGAAGILIAKSCISEIPIVYMEYLNTLEKIGYKITAKNELINLVNSTVKIGTTMIITKLGEPTKPEAVLTSLYSQGYFTVPRKFSEITKKLVNQGYNFPKASLWQALNKLCQKKMLIKKAYGQYVQRTPPEKYFSKEIVD